MEQPPHSTTTDLFTISGVGNCPSCGCHAALYHEGFCAHCLSKQIVAMNTEKPLPEQFGFDPKASATGWPSNEHEANYYEAMKKYHERKLLICKDEIVQQAVRVRKLQVEYFKYKMQHTLTQCKNTEAKLDQLLTEHARLEGLINVQPKKQEAV